MCSFEERERDREREKERESAKSEGGGLLRVYWGVAGTLTLCIIKLVE